MNCLIYLIFIQKFLFSFNQCRSRSSAIEFCLFLRRLPINANYYSVSISTTVCISAFKDNLDPSNLPITEYLNPIKFVFRTLTDRFYSHFYAVAEKFFCTCLFKLAELAFSFNKANEIEPLSLVFLEKGYSPLISSCFPWHFHITWDEFHILFLLMCFFFLFFFFVF